jgi:FolB domain-containing protein
MVAAISCEKEEFMDKILIQDLLVRGVIGVTDRERENPQDILINLVLFSDTRMAGHTDNVDNSVNYRTVAKKVFAYTEKAARFTVEALASDIARLCLAEEHVIGVRVRVEKPGAVRFSRSVGVEIERWVEEEQKQPHQVFILIGSNIDPEKNVATALNLLQQQCDMQAISSLWETEPIGSRGNNFLNLAVWLSCLEDLAELQSSILRPIEDKLGRIRTEDKYAPRTIDLDVAVFDGQVIEPRLWEISFMAVPLAEIYPNLMNEKGTMSLSRAASEMTTGIIRRRSMEDLDPDLMSRLKN